MKEWMEELSHTIEVLSNSKVRLWAGGVVTQQGIVNSCEGGELVSWASPSIFDLGSGKTSHAQVVMQGAHCR